MVIIMSIIITVVGGRVICQLYDGQTYAGHFLALILDLLNKKFIKRLNPLLHINAFDAFEISRIWKYHGKWSICSFGANAPFSIIF